MKRSGLRKRRTGMSAHSYGKLETRRCLTSVGWDGAGQGGAELTYYVGDAPATVEQAVFEDTIEEALNVWAEVADIEFTQTSVPGLPDSLDITSAYIDGNGGTLAFAYLPDDVNQQAIAGDVVFDISESWEVGNEQGSEAFDLLYVAVHELGHALGLEHNDVPGSVMNEAVSPNEAFSGLSDFDEQAIQTLYAAADIAADDETDAPVDTEDPIDNPEAPTDEPADNREFNRRDFWVWRQLRERFRPAAAFSVARQNADHTGDDADRTTQSNAVSEPPLRVRHLARSGFRFF